MDRKKPWTAGTVYIKRVLDKSFWNENCCISSTQEYQSTGTLKVETNLIHVIVDFCLYSSHAMLLLKFIFA